MNGNSGGPAPVSACCNPRKTDAAKLRTALTKLGYAADEQPADPVAFSKLGLLPEKRVRHACAPLIPGAGRGASIHL